MRIGANIFAALLILVILSFLLVYSCSIIANDQIDIYRDSMRNLVRSVGTTLEGEPLESRIDTIEKLDDEETEVWFNYVYPDGNIGYAGSEDFVLPDYDTYAASPDKASEVFENSGVCYAVFRFPEGDALLLSRKIPSGWDLLIGNRLYIYFGIIVLIMLGYSIANVASIGRKKRMISNVMTALDEFADGKFDRRIEPITGNEKEIEVYNAVIERIQTRVFKQASRNHAISIVMNQMQTGIVAVDQDLKVLVVTPVAKTLLGIIGSADGKHINEASQDVRLDELFTESMQQGGVYTNEVTALTAPGRGHRPLRLYISPMVNDGKTVGALALVEDITEIRRLERVRTDFAANVSHELKTPLTSIRGFVETLEAGAIDNPEMAHKFLRIIMMETERLTRLINDILSISKLESGDTEVTTERLRLDKMADDVADMLSIHASEKKVTVKSIKSEKPIYIIGNSDRVEQLLINLIENAIKYNRENGSVTVQVFSNDTEANVAISDTGIGIAEEHLPRLFERFYRVDKGRSRQMGGTGLGLAICKHIVKSMDGSIEVHSKLGEGTEFLITVPLAPPDDPDKDTIFPDEC